VSVETMRIVDALPTLKVRDNQEPEGRR